MAASPLASRRLYRIRWRSVTLAALALFLAALAAAQFAGRAKADKGPRALALLELAPNGKGHLVPVVIMIDGEFYDASAYKAALFPRLVHRKWRPAGAKQNLAGGGNVAAGGIGSS
jgi:hypothetical protein